jgi:Cytochrome b5-like Heme/Steroid binding domain
LIEHTSKIFRESVWISYGVGIYDITKIIESHVSPEVTILLAAGMSLDPFFDDKDMQRIHNKSRIYNMLEKCRIGNILIKQDE